ncbi:hypothetical protein SJS40_19545 [Aeromonas caviae]|uniref:hypothetical protein n=1 Tax=Aeromonas caviae TaxID=648 RepID=UPI0029DA54D2|nr:hypothetical protein [Aeromonas caviae]MDX7755707.1 hypothetical protein [Aeromonas caviae]MDX7774603.1 hypothetical protein [Aeromonas caviae]
MNEIDVLKKIASNLTERKNSAALSNYRVLCSNIAFLNDAFANAIGTLRGLHGEIESSLTNDSYLNPQYKSGTDLNAFVPIVSRLQLNSFSVFAKLAALTGPDERAHITLENVSELSKGFDDYNDLVTATRQYIDSIVSDSYQLYLLDPKSFNYHVLVSLNSFSKYATKSLAHALFNTEVESALNEFGTIKFKDWAKSHITECNHSTFAQKVDFLFSVLGAPTDPDLPDDLKNLFKFSSEFTHIGYTSTFFTSTTGAEVIFGDDYGPYLPSTENFSELKYEVLETACKALLATYIPSLIQCFAKLMVKSQAEKFAALLHQAATVLSDAISTRNSKYYFFIKAGLIGSKASIPLTCMCGETRMWVPPHATTDLYCTSCGSSFQLLEVDGDGGYIITSNGPAKVIGANVPDFRDLPVAEQVKLLKQCEEAARKAHGPQPGSQPDATQ